MAGSYRERKPGVWEVRVYAGTDPTTGKQRTLSRTVHGSKRAARGVANGLEAQVLQGKHLSKKGTLGALLDEYVRRCETLGRSAYTIKGYRSKVETHMKPHLGHLELDKVTGKKLDAFYTALHDKGLSTSSIAQNHRIIHAAFEQAIKWDLIEVNPARKATPPPVGQRPIHPPTPVDVRRLLKEADERNPTLAAFLFTAATTGCRRGELCALRWRDVDLDAEVLTVRHALVDLAGKVEIKDPKDHQVRTLALDAATVAVLRALRVLHETRASEHHTRLAPAAFVFSAAPDGSSPRRPDRVTAFMGRLRKTLDLPTLRLHDLRHFVATQALSNGVDLRTVAGRLGHGSGGAVTLRVYASFLPQPDRAAAELMGGLLSEKDDDDD